MAPWIQISDEILTKDEAKNLIKKLGLFLDQELDLNPPRIAEEVQHDREPANSRFLRLFAPARLRDGDNCRWCGVLVSWRGPRSARSGGYIHRAENSELGPLVACRACIRAGDGAPPRPAPLNPRFGEVTRALLAQGLEEFGSSPRRANSLEEEDFSSKGRKYCPNCGQSPEWFSTVADSLTGEAFLVCSTCAQDRNGLGLPLLPMKETPPQPEFVLRTLSFCSHCGNKLGSTAMDIRVWHSHVSWIMCTPCFEERLAA